MNIKSFIIIINKDIVINLSLFLNFDDRININSEKRNKDIFENIETVYIRYVIIFIFSYFDRRF